MFHHVGVHKGDRACEVEPHPNEAQDIWVVHITDLQTLLQVVYNV